MSKLAILHYLPLEYYPPVTNLIDYIASERAEDFTKVKVFSCWNIKGRKAYRSLSQKINSKNTNQPKYQNSNNLKAERSKQLISLFRSPFPKETDNSIIRLLKYLHYNLFTFLNLLIFRPNALLYYESYSVWPAYIYTRYFNRKCRIFIHHHEYASKEWYSKTMKQVKFFHKLEKRWLYPRAQWISQTNADRLNFFHQDHPYLKAEQLRIMPNYPPKSWRIKELAQQHICKLHNKSEAKSQQANRLISSKANPLKLIYVGSLSFQSTYLKELCEWVLQQEGKIQFDVYAYNLYDDVKAYLSGLNSSWIKYYEKGIEYDDQPKLLSQYDVGLILYKAHNQNYTYNAPNKLFEYLACDLDVWYPDVLQGPKPYNTEDVFPKVVPVNYENLESFDFTKAINKEGCGYKPSEFFCEEVYSDLVDEINKTTKKKNNIATFPVKKGNR